ncbi:MAG: hypothetical protein EOM64_08925 [Erysipelotrichia bacterium]|nr:hypothetical protein [Erysipelotrichia bacterium]
MTDSIKFLSNDLGEAASAIQSGNSLNIPRRKPAGIKPTATGTMKIVREKKLEAKKPVCSNSFDIPGSKPRISVPAESESRPKSPVLPEIKTAAVSAASVKLDVEEPYSIPVPRAAQQKNKTIEHHETSSSENRHAETSIPLPKETFYKSGHPVSEPAKKKSFNDELNSIFHNTGREKPKKPSYSERLAVGMKFYQHLLLVFLITCMICAAGLGYLWFWLSRYEGRSINGAVRNYLKEIAAEKWDAIYEEDTTYFIELNSKDKYISWLKDKYKDLSISSLTYSFTGADDLSQYYTVYDEYGNRITSLELRKPDNSNTWKVRTLDSTMYYNFDVLDNTGFMINSISIDSSYANEPNQIPYSFENLGLDDKMPVVTRYSIKNFVDAPDITVSDANQSTAVRDYSGNQYYVGPSPTDDQYSGFSAEILDTTTAYCQYISKDGTFTALNKHLYPNTDFYNNIIGFNNQWYSPHDSTEFQNTRIFDVMPIGSNAFIGSISFDYVVTASDVTRTTSSTYQLFFVRNSADEWKLVNLIIIASSGENDSITATPTASPEG